MIKEIDSELKRIERENNVKILYAVESGSRGWGFASKDSDYDVRFIYIRPLEDYLSIEDKKDYIEYPINNLLDINGWDIRKALKLYKKSNPPLLEWLSSPIVYSEEYSFAGKLRELSSVFFGPVPSLYHYLNLAKRTMKEISNSECVKIKKYFYILRPLLACVWIEEKQSMAPMEFNKLINGLKLDTNLLAEIDRLLDRKRSGIESDPEPINGAIFNFFNDKITYYENFAKQAGKERCSDKAILDNLYRDTLREVWAKETFL